MEGGIWSRLRSPTAVRGLSAIVEQGIYSVTSFLAGVLVARSTSQEECGVYILAMTTLVFAQGMQASLFGTPFTVLSLRLEPRERMACLGHGFLQATMFALLVTGVVLAGSWAVVRFGAVDGLVSPVFLAMGIASVVLLSQDFLRTVLMAQLRGGTSLILGLSCNSMVAAGLAAAFFTGHLNAASAFIVMAVAVGPPVIFLWFDKRRRGLMAFDPGRFRETWTGNWDFGRWLVARSLASFVAIQLYAWMLAYWHGREAVAVYGVCLGLAGIVNPFFMGLLRYLAPKAAHAALEGSRPLRRVVLSAMGLLIGPLALYVAGAALFGEWPLVALYGEKYAGAGGVFGFCAVAIGIAALTGALSVGLNALRRPDVGLKAQVLAGLASIVVGLPLVAIYGTIGAAAGLCVTNLVFAAYSWKAFADLIDALASGETT